MLLGLPAGSRQVELRAWLAAQEADLRSRREIVDALSPGDDDDLGPSRPGCPRTGRCTCTSLARVGRTDAAEAAGEQAASSAA